MTSEQRSFVCVLAITTIIWWLTFGFSFGATGPINGGFVVKGVVYFQ